MSTINLWKRVSITLGIKNRLVGGIPTDPNLIAGWIKANMPDYDDAEKAKLAAKTAAELPQATEERAEGMWTTFKRGKDEKGDFIFLEGRCVKAMFKESANILRDMLVKEDKRAKGEAGKSRFTNLKAKLAERLFVEEDIIPIHRGAGRLVKPDGSEEKAIHVMTAQGPRSALKRIDFVSAPATVRFTARYLADGTVDLDLIGLLLEHAGWNGLGTNRSQGDGLFQVVEIQEIGEKEKAPRAA